MRLVRQTKRLLPIVAIFLLLALVTARFWHREPHYDNRPLSAWLDDLDPPDGLKILTDGQAFRTESDRGIAAAKAVRAIGTNSIPTLRRWLAARDSAFALRLNGMLKPITRGRLSLPSPRTRHALAMRGLAALGLESLPFLASIDPIVDKSGQRMDWQYRGFLLAVFDEASERDGFGTMRMNVGPIMQSKFAWSFRTVWTGGQTYTIAVLDDPQGCYLSLFLLSSEGKLLDAVRAARPTWIGGFRWKVVNPPPPYNPTIMVWRTVGPGDWGSRLEYRGKNYTWRESEWQPPSHVPGAGSGPAPSETAAVHPPIGFAIVEGRLVLVPGSNDL